MKQDTTSSKIPESVPVSEHLRPYELLRIEFFAGLKGLRLPPSRDFEPIVDRIFEEVVPDRGSLTPRHLLTQAQRIRERDPAGELTANFIVSATDLYTVLDPTNVERWVDSGLEIVAEREFIEGEGELGNGELKVDRVEASELMERAKRYFDLDSSGINVRIRLAREQRDEEADTLRDAMKSARSYSRAAYFLAGLATLGFGAATFFGIYGSGNVDRNLDAKVDGLTFELDQARRIGRGTGEELLALKESSAKLESELAKTSYHRILQAREDNDVAGLHLVMDDFNLNFGEPYQHPEIGSVMAVAYHSNDCQAAAEWYARLLTGPTGVEDKETLGWVVDNTLPLCANVDPSEPAIIFYTRLPELVMD